MRKIGIYVDGSAPINVASATNPAGWGVVIVEDPKNHEGGEILASYAGPVITDPDELSHVGAEVGSNNTAELSAIWWALYIMRALSLLGDVEVTIYGDSEYAGKMANGSWKPKENKELVKNVKAIWQRTLLNCNSLVWAHVRAHQGNYYNEMADELANRGVHLEEDHKPIDIDM
jgi:ribonuclease HI